TDCGASAALMCSAGLAIRQVWPPSVVFAAYCPLLRATSVQPALRPTSRRLPPPGAFVPGVIDPGRVNTVPFTVLAGLRDAAVAPPTATPAVAASAAAPPAAPSALPRMVPLLVDCVAPTLPRAQRQDNRQDLSNLGVRYTKACMARAIWSGAIS